MGDNWFENDQQLWEKEKQAGAELCQAQIKLGLAKIKPLRSHIQSFGTLGQLLEFSTKKL